MENEKELSSSLSQNIPSPDKGVVEIRNVEGTEIRIIKNGVPLGYNSVVSIPYAVAAIKNGKYIYVFAVERDDLRAISHFSGVAVKTLSEEYGVKGYLLEPRGVIYYQDEVENIGVINLSQSEDSIIAFLYETALESLDLIDGED